MNLKFTLLFVLCMITITSVSALTLNDNVEIAWSFDQSSTTNTTVEDNSGNGHNLTINAPINITSAIVNEGHQIYADNSGNILGLWQPEGDGTMPDPIPPEHVEALIFDPY